MKICNIQYVIVASDLCCLLLILFPIFEHIATIFPWTYFLQSTVLGTPRVWGSCVETDIFISESTVHREILAEVVSVDSM